MTVPMHRMDVPLSVVEAEIAAVQLLAAARIRTASPSDRIAFALDGWLITHHDAPVSTDRDYPAWAAALAAQPTYHRPEAS
jgi:hypothetical protein